MKSNRKTQSYSPEFRESAVKLAIESDQSRAATARDLGVNVNTLHTWISNYQTAKGAALQPFDEQHLYDQLKKLRKENHRLKEERDILKNSLRAPTPHRLETLARLH